MLDGSGLWEEVHTHPPVSLASASSTPLTHTWSHFLPWVELSPGPGERAGMEEAALTWPTTHRQVLSDI